MKRISIIFLISFLVGCSGANIKPMAQVSPEKSGEIRIYRPDAFLMKYMPAIVSVNTIDAVQMDRDNSAVIKLNEGSYLLNVRGGGLDGNDGCDLNIDLKSNEIKYIELSPASSSGAVAVIPLANFLVCKFELEEVQGAEAEKQYNAFPKVPVSYL